MLALLSRNQKLAVVSVLVAIILLILIDSRDSIIENRNSLALGSQSIKTQAFSMSIVRPVELDGMSREQILDARSQLINQRPDLLATEYVPYPPIFAGIKDGAGWYGTKGFLVNLRGEQAIEGPSRDSLYILNPFLLIGIEFWGASNWFGRRLEWDNSKPFEREAPFLCVPQAVEWQPAQRKVEILYDYSGYINSLNRYLVKPVDPAQNQDFALVTINARDFNYNFLAADIDRSIGLSIANLTGEPLPLLTSFVFDAACRHSTGCNMEAPIPAPLEHITINSLPARLALKLWREKPISVADAADLNYDIRIE